MGSAPDGAHDQNGDNDYFAEEDYEDAVDDYKVAVLTNASIKFLFLGAASSSPVWFIERVFCS